MKKEGLGVWKEQFIHDRWAERENLTQEAQKRILAEQKKIHDASRSDMMVL
jgi:hypothetical protein